jgi:hypothetical protein
MYVCLCVCMFQHNFGAYGAISTKLGTPMTPCIYIYIYIYRERERERESYMYHIYLYSIYLYIKMNLCVCVYVEQFQPNLVHI